MQELAESCPPALEQGAVTEPKEGVLRRILARAAPIGEGEECVWVGDEGRDVLSVGEAGLAVVGVVPSEAAVDRRQEARARCQHQPLPPRRAEAPEPQRRRR